MKIKPVALARAKSSTVTLAGSVRVLILESDTPNVTKIKILGLGKCKSDEIGGISCDACSSCSLLALRLHLLRRQ